MKSSIKKVAVLGSGIMGSRIACHFANIGVEVILLDIAPKGLTEKEKASGKMLQDKIVRNRIVNDFLLSTIKSSPSPLYRKSFADNITTGNFEDNMKDISSCDWVIEAVIERLDIKKIIFEQVEQHRKQGTIISTNTSGIPIDLMLEGRSEDFQKHFCGTHFFNPPRYLRLLEIIPSPKTSQEVIDFLMYYGDLYLGKEMVQCKNTPAFIANRIGTYSIVSLFHLVKEMGLTVDEVDALTGPILGRPKSATFRTCDLVGLDTLAHVAKGIQDNCPDDEAKALFSFPDYVAKMMANEWYGSKSKQGFYKKVKGEDGKSEILTLNIQTLEYQSKQKVKYATLELAKPIDDLKARTKALLTGKDKAGEFYRKLFYGLFQYVGNRIPEIADDLYSVDDAIKTGFGWQLGTFEVWDILGVERTVKAMEENGTKAAAWIHDMLSKGVESFYRIEGGKKQYYDWASSSYKNIPGTENFILLETVRPTHTIWKNAGCSITDIGDGIINLEFHSKMNTIGSEVIQGINHAIDIAEKDYRGLVISNEGDNFSAGANVGMIFMMAVEQEFDEIDFAIRAFQNTMMRIRYSSIPVVVAPHNMALGGGCEMSLHADRVQAHAELYMGLVEFGVGLIPAGGGSKEFAIKISDSFAEGDIRTNTFRNNYLTIGQAKVSTSAHEAFDLGYLSKGKDAITINRKRLLADAKASAIQMAETGYTQPLQRKDIEVLGKGGLGLIYVGADSMHTANYISAHDKLISEKLGYVLCGGDLSSPTKVSEQYLLDLEREAFLSLCGERKTLERLESILKKGKILRN